MNDCNSHLQGLLLVISENGRSHMFCFSGRESFKVAGHLYQMPETPMMSRYSSSSYRATSETRITCLERGEGGHCFSPVQSA